jgi:hypothetical protein
MYEIYVRIQEGDHICDKSRGFRKEGSHLLLKNVSTESGRKERLGLCTVENFGPRGSYGTVLKIKEN